MQSCREYWNVELHGSKNSHHKKFLYDSKFAILTVRVGSMHSRRLTTLENGYNSKFVPWCRTIDSDFVARTYQSLLRSICTLVVIVSQANTEQKYRKNWKREKKERGRERESGGGEPDQNNTVPSPPWTHQNEYFIFFIIDLPSKRTCHGKGRHNNKT